MDASVNLFGSQWTGLSLLEHFSDCVVEFCSIYLPDYSYVSEFLK
jgi:hypothetical protein